MSPLRPLALLAATAALAAVPAGANAENGLPGGYHECQKPVKTGVEVYDLHHVRSTTACPVALELFAWENSSAARARALYGCHRPKPEAAGYPYLRLHRFRGWRLSLSGRYKEFTMSRGRASFKVGGTDFPLNCT